MITGNYNIKIYKGDKSITRILDNWHSYEPEVYIKMVIKEMVSELNSRISKSGHGKIPINKRE